MSNQTRNHPSRNDSLALNGLQLPDVRDRFKDLLRQVEDDDGQNPLVWIAAAQEVVAILIDQQRSRWRASAQATGYFDGHEDRRP